MGANNEQTERELFEKWATNSYVAPLGKTIEGCYSQEWVSDLWKAFQAGRASLPASDWNAAIEACAKICDDQHDRARTSSGAARADACAERIRALKRPETIGDDSHDWNDAVEAANRVHKFVAGRAMCKGLDQTEIGGVHTGSKHEAHLMTEDLQTMISFIKRQPSEAGEQNHVREAFMHVERLEKALMSIRQAAGSCRHFTNRLQFIYERAGVALAGDEWDESWKAENGYKKRATILEENERLKREIDLLRSAPQAAPSTAVPEALKQDWQLAAQWVLNNYQDYENVGAMVDAMLAADPAQQAQSTNEQSSVVAQPVAGDAGEREEDEYVIKRLAGILADISIAFKGPELPLHRQSYHDLGQLAQKKMLEIDLLRYQVEELQAALASAPSEPRPTDDDLWDQTLQDRDRYIDMADQLADAIAKHLNVDIGEHSSANCPWTNAIEALNNAPSEQDKLKLHPVSDWHEEYGDCLFFHFDSFDEPPQVCCDSPLTIEPEFDEKYWTHFVRFDFNAVINAAIAAQGKV